MTGLFDFVELLWYVFGFWRFLFSRTFRRQTLDRWANAKNHQVLWIPFEIVIAVGCGLVLPLWLLSLALHGCAD